MSDNEDTPKKPTDLRARLGRKLPKSGAGDSQDAVVRPPEDLSQSSGRRGSVAPPPTFLDSDPPDDPFAAKRVGQSEGPQQVRIVLDEEAVASAQASTAKQTLRVAITTSAIAIAIGALIGGLIASSLIGRGKYNEIVRDGKAVLESVQAGSKGLEQAQGILKRVLRASKESPGETPRVDYEAIKSLRSLEVPFKADAFVGRRYDEFNAETVVAIFEYYQRIQQLWERFDALANQTLPKARQVELNGAAKNLSRSDSTITGCVPHTTDAGIRCGLVYVDPSTRDPSKARVRSSRNANQGSEKQVYTGQNLNKGLSDYVILVNPEQSKGVLTQENAFRAYQKQVDKISKELQDTLSIQGKLEVALGDVASLKEIWAP